MPEASQVFSVGTEHELPYAPWCFIPLCSGAFFLNSAYEFSRRHFEDSQDLPVREIPEKGHVFSGGAKGQAVRPMIDRDLAEQLAVFAIEDAKEGSLQTNDEDMAVSTEGGGRSSLRG